MHKITTSLATLGGVAVLCLASCGQAETPEPTSAETEAPDVEEAISEVAAEAEQEISAATEVETTSEEETHDHSHDGDEHDHDDHKHDDGHDHGQDHGEDHDHEHGDNHSHDHDHDHSGVGEAHVHGKGDLAATLDGTTLSVSFESPLASFASFEHEPKTNEQREELTSVETAFMDVSSNVVVNTEAACDVTSREVGFRHSGDHGSVSMTYTFECAAPEALSSLSFTTFSAYPALESVDAVFLTDASQSAKTLTAQDNTIALE
ncbi:MAG: DUF2796 domain-containing protein [Pseudomonadota bacterium]